MTLGRYIFFMVFSTLLSWLAWLLVIFQIDPTQTGFMGFTLFYLTLLCALAGTFSLIGLLVRVLIFKTELMFRLVYISFRQSISYAVLLVAALWLKSQDLLSWWNIILLILILGGIEYLHITFRKNANIQHEA